MRAAARTLTARVFENMCANFAFALPCPSEPRIIVRTTDEPGADEHDQHE